MGKLMTISLSAVSSPFTRSRSRVFHCRSREFSDMLYRWNFGLRTCIASLGRSSGIGAGVGKGPRE